ncbi:ATP-binding protein [Pseudomonas sp. SID14000]|uniref:ATP-binding protein n=1 Tax=Pseudomonas sp. SID14000 TaxID=1986221 RepID=UPI000B3C1609|nr:ATP-binding protein [Pseudomonas sp. SID14000]
MDTEIKDRLERYSQQVVFFKNYRSSYALILKAIETTQLRGSPNCALITGPSGTGKSTLLSFTQAAYPSKHYVHLKHDKQLIIPVVKCTLPPATTPKSLVKTILISLDCDELQGDTVDLTHRLKTLLRTCQVQAVLIDEFQFLIKKDAFKTQETVISWLVRLLDETATPFILVGRDEEDTESLYYRSCENLIYRRADLARRFPFHAKLDLLAYSDLQNSEYQTVLTELDAQMYAIGELGPGTHLTDPGIRERIYLASLGNLEIIKLLTFNALQLCLSQNPKVLSIDLLARSYALVKLINNLPDRQNPFSMSQSECSRQVN